MPSITSIGITGSDGHVPIYDPEARWTIWSLTEIYKGQAGYRKFVPKVNDYVRDPAEYRTYIVRDINPITLIPELVEIYPFGTSIGSINDVLLGPGSDSYRVYLDKSVYPYTLAVDSRLMVAGSSTKYARLYQGPDVHDSTKIISRVFNNSGDFIGHDVHLELVAFDSHDNHSIKTIPTCNTIADLTDGEIVSAIILDNRGHVLSKKQLLVENTSFIKQAFSRQKFITDISIESPFLSRTSTDTIEFPINIPINSLGLIARIHYNDGSSVKFPVNGTKFKIYGIDQYVSTIIGQELPLVLSYTLDDGEATYSAVSSDGKYITKPYKLITVEPNNSYNIKLFGYPEWLNAVSGYRMTWWLTNLDRNVALNVTANVRFSETTGAFNPKLYGYLQRMGVTLDLTEVDRYYKPYIHVQLVDILLRDNPNNSYTPWEISNEVATQSPMYGENLRAVREAPNANMFTIHSGITDLAVWLDRVYYRTKPLINPSKESTPIRPSHIEISYMDKTTTVTVEKFRETFNLNITPQLYKNIYIKFLKQTPSGYMILSISAMAIY